MGKFDPYEKLETEIMTGARIAKIASDSFPGDKVQGHRHWIDDRALKFR